MRQKSNYSIIVSCRKKISFVAHNILSFIRKKPITVVLVIFACLALAFLVVERSPLGPLRGGDPSVDSSVFRYIGQEMVDGNTPYLDTFDHKGPLIYIANWLGSLINARRGVWLVEFLCLFVLALISYRTFRLLKCRVGLSVVGVSALMLAILPYFEDGNYTEEFAMPFIAGGLYVFIDYFIHGKTKWWKVFLCGACLGAVLLLRINMIPLWVVFGLVIGVKYTKSNGLLGLLQLVGWVLLGVLAIVAPVMIWLASKGAIGYFVEDYLIFNFLYASGGDMNERFDVLFLFLSAAPVMSSLLISLYAILKNKKDDRLLSISIFCSLLLSLAIACMSGRPYMHYMMITVPIFAYPFAILLSDIGRAKGHAFITYRRFAILFFCGVLILPWLSSSYLFIKDNLDESTRGKPRDVTVRVSEVISENTSPTDKIAVYGSWNDIYLRTNRRSASKYSYTYALSAVKPENMGEYYDELSQDLPVLVVTQGEYLDENVGGLNYMLFDFLEKNNYSTLWQETDRSGAPTGTTIYKLDS